MNTKVPLRLEPDWPRIRQLAAKKLRCTEEQVQAMKDRGNSLDQVELLVTIEEILDELKS
jgi:hypothetical protein